ncbi:MAG TPA: serine/threonine-protein kinase, partial [Pyrinomonadaceae bacterium]
LIKRIPNWLQDGFLDAKDFLRDSTQYHQDTNIFNLYSVFSDSEPKKSGSRTPSLGLIPEITSIISSQKLHKTDNTNPSLLLPDPQQTNYEILNLERYEIERKLGAGGMGEVYLATDKSLKRRVALKVLNTRIGDSKELAIRFQREAIATANLHHPNIVQVYDFLTNGGRAVLVTEFIEGLTLEDLLKRKGIFSIVDTVQIALTVAEALEAAHNIGIIHRDIKPSNIMINTAGDIKLLDFGIAKLQDTTSEAITQVGTIVGTPAYISPEQIEAENKVDIRSDLYSLGAVMYRMLTGSNYFGEETSTPGIIYKVMQLKPSPPSDKRPEIPIQLDKITLKLLEKNRNNRFSTAGDLIKELKHFSATELK